MNVTDSDLDRGENSIGEWFEDLTTPNAIALWISTRAFLLALLLVLEVAIITDVHYYFSQIGLAPSPFQLDGIMPEYPTAILGLLALPRLVSGGSFVIYAVIFIGLMLATDALMSIALWRLGTALPFWIWTLGVTFIGPITFVRYDVLPAAIVGLVLLTLAGGVFKPKQGGRPVLSGGLLAFGVAVKLWPVAILPALLTRRELIKKVLLGFIAVGAAVLLISLPFGGADRLIAPFAHQEGRGLQVESVWASPPMLAFAFGSESYDVAFAHYTFEVSGPGTEALSKAATISIGLAALFIFALAIRAYLSRADGVTSLLVVTIVLLIIVTNKVFSPQYMLWLLAPVAILATRPHRLARVIAYSTLGISLLTHLVYPLFYDEILVAGSDGGILATLLLVIRNLWLVGITVLACWWAWKETGVKAASPSAVDSQPVGG